MRIHKTQDYTLFKRIAGNRNVSQPHVSRLKLAIEEDPDTITYNPIIVNEDYEVIDGQHRLEAMQELQLPVHYIRVNGLDLEAVQKLNSVAKVWSPMDFAKSYRELGNKNYTLYIEFKQNYGFNHEALLTYLSLDGYCTNTMFKNGKLKVSDPARSQVYCNYLRDITLYYERALLRNQAKGIFTVISSPKYDHARMMQKLKMHAHKIQEQPTANDYAREFERIYNYHSRQGSTRLY